MAKAILPDIKDNTRAAMADLLNARLADAINLKLAVKQAHWNVKGKSFIAIHELFDAIAGRIEAHYDDIAERIVQLGGTAKGTTQVVARNTTLAAYPLDIISQDDHIKAVRDRMAAFAKTCRKAIGQADDADDAVTADLLTGVVRGMDKDIWFLAAHMG
jgi:starvation-inducible DNA-binding protein